MSKFIEVTILKEDRKAFINAEHIFMILPDRHGSQICFVAPKTGGYEAIDAAESYEEVKSAIHRLEQ